MASKGESVGSLFLSLGLDLTSLESSYLEADKSVMENQRKLQRVIDSNKLKLKMESKLDGAESAQNQLKLLNDTLKLQTEQVRIAEAEFKKCYAEAGAGASKTITAERQLIKIQSAQADTINQIRQLEIKAANDKISKINTEMNLVRQKMELYKSSPALDAEQKHSKALEATNRLLELQKQKVQELNAMYRQQVHNNGAGSSQAMSMQTTLLKEATALNQMQSNKTSQLAAMAMLANKSNQQALQNTALSEMGALKSMAAESAALLKTTLVGMFVTPVLNSVASMQALKPALDALKNLGGTSSGNWLTSKQQELQSKLRELSVTPAMKQIQEWFSSHLPVSVTSASSSIGGFVSSLMGMSVKAGAVLAVLTGVGYAVAKLGEKAAEAGDSVVSLAGRLHTTNGEASKLKRAMSFVGVDVEDGVNSLLRMNKQVMSAKDGANDTTRMLHAFGVELKKQDGTFKNYNQQLAELAKGYAKAKELGMSTEYMTTLFGTRGKAMYDFFDEYEKVMQMSANVKTAGILNPDTAHQMKMQYGQLNAQVSQLTAGISQLLSVAAQPLIQPLTELFKELVSVIYENKVAYTAFFAAIGEGLKVAVQLFESLFIPALKVTSAQASILCKAVIEDLCPGINYLGACAATAWVRMKHLFSGWNTEECRAELKKVYEELENDNKYLHDMLYGADKKIMPKIDTDAQKQALAEITGETEKAEKAQEEAHKKAVENMNEADKIRYHLTHSNVENQMYDLEQLTNKQLAEAKTEEEANSIRALSAAKLLEIQKNAEREAEEIHKRVQQNIQEAESIRFKRSHNEWQNQLYDIQQNAEAQAKLAKSADEVKSVWQLAAEKTADVWQKLVDKIKGMNRSLEDKIFALTHSASEVKQHETAKEALNYLQQGADPRLVQRWYDLIAQKEGFGQRGDSYNFGHVIDLQQQETANIGNLAQQMTELVNYNRQQSYASNGDTYGSMGHTIDLNVNVYGLEDVSNEVAQTAAKEIIEKMPSDSQYNISYGY